MRKARLLTNRSNINWMISSGIIRDATVIQPNVLTKYSQQCTTGYEICRVEINIIDPYSDWASKYLCPAFVPRTLSPSEQNQYPDLRNLPEKCFSGYHNEFEWVSDDMPFADLPRNGCSHADASFIYGTAPFVQCRKCSALGSVSARISADGKIDLYAHDWNDQVKAHI